MLQTAGIDAEALHTVSVVIQRSEVKKLVTAEPQHSVMYWVEKD